MDLRARELSNRLAVPLAVVAGVVLLLVFRQDDLKFLLLGAGSGALIAAIALGVVLTHRGSGVVNFATGSMAMYIAYTFDSLRRHGQLLLPPLPNPLSIVEGVAHLLGSSLELPNIPTFVSLGGPLSFWPALVLSLAVAALLGFFLHIAIFRPLHNSPPLAKVVASIGVFLAVQAIIILRYTAQTRPALPILPAGPVTILGITVPQSQLILLLIVTVLAVALWALFRLTKFGLATRAAAESEKGAVLLGLAPGRLAAINWMMASVLVGALGILVAPLTQLDPTKIPLLVVPALGAALIGRLSLFGATAAVAVGIGMCQSWLTFAATKSWFPHAGTVPYPGVAEALPLVVIVLAMLVRGKKLPTREAVASARLPSAPRPTKVALRAAIPAAFGVLGLLILSGDWRQAIINTVIGALICLSMVVLTGYVGQISLAQMTIGGVSGFALSKLVVEHGVPFPLGALAGATVAALVGLVVAIPALRVRGVNLAIITLAAAVAIESMVFDNPSLSNGSAGAPIPPPHLGPIKLGPNVSTAWKLVGYGGDGKLPNPWFGVFCLIVLVGVALLVVNLRRSATGRQMLAVRSNERAAAAAGTNVAGTKLLAFAVAAFIAGLAGALSGYRFGAVTSEYFGSLQSLVFFAFAYLGGIASVSGGITAGLLVSGGVGFVMSEKWFGIPSQFTLLIGGVGLVLMAVFNPEGVAGFYRAALAKAAEALRVRRSGDGRGEGTSAGVGGAGGNPIEPALVKGSP